MSRFAISSWSLDGLLTAGLPLSEVPTQMVQRGLRTLELCHFHLRSTAADDLAEFRQILDDTGVELYTLLIDTGDITAPDPATGAAELEQIQRWIGVAATLGAKQVRIAAGKQTATPDVIARSAQHLRRCAEVAAGYGLRTITENWLLTGEQPHDLLAILDLCDQTVGLCADTGNAEATPDKYATLAQLIPRATSVHFKARYLADGTVDSADVAQCAQIMHQAHFDGVITLIYADKHDEWAGIEQLRTALEPVI
jgi:sugar phosphate isomerase/epimerase